MIKVYLATKEEIEALKTIANNANSASQTAMNAANDAVDKAYDAVVKASDAMPKSGGAFTGNVVFAVGNDIMYEYEGEQYPLMGVIGNMAGAVAEISMPKAGGQFTGTVYQHREDTSGVCLRGINIVDDAWQSFSTCDFAFVRK